MPVFDFNKAMEFVHDNKLPISQSRVGRVLAAWEKEELSDAEKFERFKHFTYSDTTGETAVKNLMRTAS